ncbi:7875_t:CDS:2, partial [Cetraspora pellucida]
IELDSKVSELERLKSEDISISVVGKDSEKNISKSRPEGKIINEVEKISIDIPTHTNNKIVPILESSKIDTKVTSKIKNMTPIRSHNITIERSEELPIIALDTNMTTSGNLFSGIYSQSKGTNVPKLTMNEQSEEAVLRVSNSSDIQKNQKKELLQNKPKE